MPGSASDTEQWGQSTRLLGQWAEDTHPSLMGSQLENAALSFLTFSHPGHTPSASPGGAVHPLGTGGTEHTRWPPDPGLSLGSVD